jgi:hypothetical protein
MIRRLLVVSALAILALAGVPSARAQTAPAPASVFPAAGPPGTRFGFVAAGFRSGERVGVWLNAPDGRVLSVDTENLRRATRDGRTNWFWTAPENVRPGAYQMVARGLTTGVQHVIPFEVAAVVTPPPDENVVPAVGVPGGLFTFYAAGFRQGEVLRFWLNTPASRAVAVPPSDIQRPRFSGGRLDFGWVAPNDAALGAYSMVVRGLESGAEQAIRFEIGPVASPPALRGDGAQANVQPGVARPGALLLFFATGYTKGERVTFWVNRPDGTAAAAEPERVRIEDGRLDFSWQAPEGWAPGRYEMVALGGTSATQRVIPFELR